MEARTILRDLVAINTVKDNNNLEVMNYIESFYSSLGIETERIVNERTRKEILVAGYGDKPVIGFMGHTDTVDVSDGWATDPFVLTEKSDGMLYGLGACDMKGGMACWMAAISNLDIKSVKNGFRCYHTYDEEISFEGIKDLLRSGARFPSHMIIAEPTDLVPCRGSKGLLEYKIVFKGKTSHSSTPIKGQNSNKNAVRFLHRMLVLERNLRREINVNYSVPHTTMNIGIINGGTSIGKVPSRTEVYIDFRICDYKKEYSMIKNQVNKALVGLNASYEIINNIPSFENKGELIKIYEEKTGKQSSCTNGITEASFLIGDRIIIGPGPRTSHESNEHISVKSLEETTKLYGDMFKLLCCKSS